MAGLVSLFLDEAMGRRGPDWELMKGSDEERAELDRLTELLGRHTRSGKLLAHIGEKYFQGEAEQLTEFNIATEVFGRSPKSFVAADDAIVRVEAHRLRKKLRDAYA